MSLLRCEGLICEVGNHFYVKGLCLSCVITAWKLNENLPAFFQPSGISWNRPFGAFRLSLRPLRFTLNTCNSSNYHRKAQLHILQDRLGYLHKQSNVTLSTLNLIILSFYYFIILKNNLKILSFLAFLILSHFNNFLRVCTAVRKTILSIVSIFFWNSLISQRYRKYPTTVFFYVLRILQHLQNRLKITGEVSYTIA